MDREFECIKDDMDQVQINTSAAREYVGEIERQICLIKERTRCVPPEMSEGGYNFLHRMIVIHCIYFVCFMIKNEISKEVPQRCTRHVRSYSGSV